MMRLALKGGRRGGGCFPCILSSLRKRWILLEFHGGLVLDLDLTSLLPTCSMFYKVGGGGEVVRLHIAEFVCDGVE